MPELEADPAVTSVAVTGPGSDGPQAYMAGVLGTAREAVIVDTIELAPQARVGVGGWLAVTWLTVIVLAALAAPILPIDDPYALAEASLDPPSANHWFGTDAAGRDVFARVIWGARTSLVVSVSAVMIGLVVGGALGLIAGYLRGATETVLTTFFDAMLAFPQLVLALSLVAVLASGEDISATRRLVVLIVALGIVAIPILARITRANTLIWSQREFVTAARSMGAKSSRILVREVLPNVLPAMFSISLLGIAVAIVAEGGLSLLGVGVQPPTPSWGNIIAEGRNNLAVAPFVILFPTLFIFFTVLALNYLGDVIRARFDVRESAL
ncbi:MAG: ABC transporter permease [Acidimicrobiales bacterium]